MARSASCLHGNQNLIAYCISTLISSSRPSTRLTHSHAIYPDSSRSSSSLFPFWCHGLGLHVSFISPFRGWVVRVLKIMVFASFFRSSFFQRIVIDHFRIMDSGLASWELQEYLVCAFSCGFRTFPLKNKYRRLEGSSCCRLLWLLQSLLAVPCAVGDQIIWKMGRWESIFDGCFFFVFAFFFYGLGRRGEKRISSWEWIMKAILQRLLFAHFFVPDSLGCLVRLRASVCVPVCSLCCFHGSGVSSGVLEALCSNLLLSSLNVLGKWS